MCFLYGDVCVILYCLQALDILLELTASSSELPNSGQHHTSNTQSKDNRAPLEASYNVSNMFFVYL